MAEDKHKLDLFFKSLEKLIEKFRKEKKFSLEELGLRIGIDSSAMHRIENGKAINVSTIVKLSLALDKKPKDFFDFSFDIKTYELGGLVKSKKSPQKKKSLKKALPSKKVTSKKKK